MLGVNRFIALAIVCRIAPVGRFTQGRSLANPVLGLIFLKLADNRFAAVRRFGRLASQLVACRVRQNAPVNCAQHVPLLAVVEHDPLGQQRVLDLKKYGRCQSCRQGTPAVPQAEASVGVGVGGGPAEGVPTDHLRCRATNRHVCRRADQAPPRMAR